MDAGVLVTAGGHRLPALKLTAGMLVNKTIVLYGSSGTGKTVIIKNIMRVVSDQIDQILLVSPTEPSNRSYDGYIDPALIHYSLDLPDPRDPKDTPAKRAMRLLESIFKRQEMMAAIFTRASRSAVIAQLYQRLSAGERRESDGIIESLGRKRRRAVAEIHRTHAADAGRAAEELKVVDEKFRDVAKLVHRRSLVPAVGRLWARRDLSEDERYTLRYLCFKPHLLLIFDDCAADLKPYFKKAVLRKLFYQNRHVFITMVISCQDDTDLPANLRKNAFVSIFAESIVCTANFDRASNSYPKATRVLVTESVGEVFKGFRKMAYIRDDSKKQYFYHLTCENSVPSLFGSPALAQLCNAVHADGVAMDKDNPFYDKFKI